MLPARKHRILARPYQGNRNISELNGPGVDFVSGIYGRVMTGKSIIHKFIPVPLPKIRNFSI